MLHYSKGVYSLKLSLFIDSFWVFSILYLQNKENRLVSEKLIGLETSYAAESERLRSDLNRLRGVEEDAKNKTNQVTSLLEELEKLKKELSAVQQEKKTIEDWAQTYREEMEKVRQDPQNRICTFTYCFGAPPFPCIYSSALCSSIYLHYYVFFSSIICSVLAWYQRGAVQTLLTYLCIQIKWLLSSTISSRPLSST